MDIRKFKLDDIDEYPGEMYGRVLWSQDLGYPMWIPQPTQSSPSDFADLGVLVGDIGIICLEGYFQCLFNVFLPPDHPRNKDKVPDGFVPMATLPPNTVTEQLESLVVTTKGVHVDIQTSSSESGDRERSYNIKSTQIEDAALVLPNGCVREDVANVDEVLRHASRYAADWYRITNDFQKIDAINGSLHIVTGHDKSVIWLRANFRDIPRSPSGLAELNIKATTREKLDGSGTETSYTLPLCYGDVLTLGPQEDGKHRVVNQCLFLRTVCVQLQDNVWKYLLIPRWRRAWNHVSSIWKREDVIVTAMYKNPSSLAHPSRLITSYLLQKMPKAKVSIAHHSIWTLLLEKGEEIPGVDELNRRIQNNFTVDMDKDSKSAFLTPRVQ